MFKPFRNFGAPLIIVAAFLWSLDGFLRQGLYTLPATVIVFLEHLLGFIVILPFVLGDLRSLKKLDRKTWLAIAWVAIWGGVLGTVFYTKALGYVNYISLSSVVLLQKLQPVFAIGLAVLFLGERPKRQFWIWAVIALIGGYAVSFPTLLPTLTTGDKTWLASLLAVGAAFAWGSSTVFSKKSLHALHYRTATAVRFGLTAALLFIVLIINGNLTLVETLTPVQWQYLLMIVFSTGLVALVIYYAGLRLVPASVSTICELFWPISAVMLDLAIHGNVLTITQWLGAAVLLAAIYKISNLNPKAVEVTSAHQPV
jgi:drug/metabolite transporter (DMT)-like permease